jgi:hypothetical protein
VASKALFTVSENKLGEVVDGWVCRKNTGCRFNDKKKSAVSRQKNMKNGAVGTAWAQPFSLIW